MSYALYIGKNHTNDGHAFLAGYGDEPSSHWLEIIPRMQHAEDCMVSIGVGADADMPGVRLEIPQVKETARHIRVSYSYYKGVPAPITNGGLNEYGVAVRDVWSTSRAELIAMTPDEQVGLNYSDLARMVMERAHTAREGVELMGQLIAEHGESTYGGNSHIIADANEAWVVIQFAGGKDLWLAERLDKNSIRASRPGYIGEVPVDEPDHPDFLYSENFTSFAKEQGWYDGGVFNANEIYGDGKGRWEGVQWIEAEMFERSKQAEKITLADVMWALRTPKLTGDTAGYGQVVPLTNPTHNELRMLWHAPIGPVAASFAPVFMGQNNIPAEFGMHRYLTVGESHRFLDTRRINEGDADALSFVPQRNEAYRSAVYESKRLLYLMLQDGDRFMTEVHESFEGREALLASQCMTILAIADTLIVNSQKGNAVELIEYFSETELLASLELVQVLSKSIEARIKALGLVQHDEVKMFDQIW